MNDKSNEADLPLRHAMPETLRAAYVAARRRLAELDGAQLDRETQRRAAIEMAARLDAECAQLFAERRQVQQQLQAIATEGVLELGLDRKARWTLTDDLTYRAAP